MATYHPEGGWRSSQGSSYDFDMYYQHNIVHYNRNGQVDFNRPTQYNSPLINHNGILIPRLQYNGIDYIHKWFERISAVNFAVRCSLPWTDDQSTYWLNGHMFFHRGTVDLRFGQPAVPGLAPDSNWLCTPQLTSDAQITIEVTCASNRQLLLDGVTWGDMKHLEGDPANYPTGWDWQQSYYTDGTNMMHQETIRRYTSMSEIIRNGGHIDFEFDYWGYTGPSLFKRMNIYVYINGTPYCIINDVDAPLTEESEYYLNRQNYGQGDTGTVFDLWGSSFNISNSFIMAFDTRGYEEAPWNSEYSSSVREY